VKIALLYGIGFALGALLYLSVSRWLFTRKWPAVYRAALAACLFFTLITLQEIGVFDRLARRVHVWINLDHKH
jgi:hypothetical protein